MNLSELLQIDVEHIKNIDWRQARDDIFRKNDTFLITVLLVLTPLGCFFIYSEKNKEAKALAQSMIVLEKKLTALQNLQAAKKELGEYVAQFPDPIPGDELIDEISRMADKHNIQILTISPLQQNRDENYDLTTVNLSVIAGNISDMRSFFETIENSPFPLRIDGWSVRIESPLAYNPETTNSIRSNIDIALVKIKK